MSMFDFRVGLANLVVGEGVDFGVGVIFYELADDGTAVDAYNRRQNGSIYIT